MVLRRRSLALALALPLAAAFVAPPRAARGAAPLAAAATAELPVVGLDGAAAGGTKTLSLETSKSGKDMYVVHRKFVKEGRDARAGTASTKTRAEVRGGGRKPYKQKGTGRARQGSTRSPLKVGGGVIFGPKPKNWANTKLNKKEARLAVGIAIQNRAPSAVVVDGLEGLVSEPKTKAVADFLVSLGQVDKSKNEYQKTLLVVDESDAAKVASLQTAAKNVPNTLLRGVNGGTSLKVRELLWADKIVYSSAALAYVNEHFKPSRAEEAAP